jgi:chitinase
MNYDVHGPWDATVGSNAPFKDSCAPPAMQAGSAVSAFEAWKNAGFLPNQIILGVAGYGHSFSVRREDAYNKTTGKIQLYAPFNKALQPHGDKWDSTTGDIDKCGNPTVVGGIFNFWGLVESNFLDDCGNPAKGIDYTFDTCSKTVRDSRAHISHWFTDDSLNPASHI